MRSARLHRLLALALAAAVGGCVPSSRQPAQRAVTASEVGKTPTASPVTTALPPGFPTNCPHTPLGGFKDCWQNDQVWPRLGCAVEPAIPVTGTKATLCCQVRSFWIREKRLFVLLNAGQGWVFLADGSGLPADAVLVTPTWMPPNAAPGPPTITPVPTPPQVPPLASRVVTSPSPARPSATASGPVPTVVLMVRRVWAVDNRPVPCDQASGRHGWVSCQPPWGTMCCGQTATSEEVFEGSLERFEGGWLFWDHSLCYVLFDDGTWAWH